MERSDEQAAAACISDAAVDAAKATASFGWQGGDAACEHVACKRFYDIRSEADESRPMVALGGSIFVGRAAPREIAVLVVCDCGAKALMGRERYAPGVRAGFAPDRRYAAGGF